MVQMYLETTEEITFNTQSVKGTETGVVRAYIDYIGWQDGYKTVGVNYRYVNQTTGKLIKEDTKVLELEVLNQLNVAVIPLLTETALRELTMERDYLGFSFEMASSYQIPRTKINLVKFEDVVSEKVSPDTQEQDETNKK